MRAFNLLFSMLALASFAAAFYPWFPDYLCAKTFDCKEAKDADDGQILGRGDEVSVKIVQRLPEVSYELYA